MFLYVFMNATKAFSRVNHSKLFTLLTNRKVNSYISDQVVVFLVFITTCVLNGVERYQNILNVLMV